MAVHPFTGLFLAVLPVLLGGCGVPVGVAIASYAADGVLWVTTDKTSTDHLLSMTSGKDCSVLRVIDGREVCVERKPGAEDPYKIDRNAPHREVGEGGMVTVYAASRAGGRILTDEEARLALQPRTVVAATPPPVVAAAPAGDPAPVLRTGHRQEAASGTAPAARKRVQARKPAVTAVAAKRPAARQPVAAGRKPTPVSAGRPSGKPPTVRRAPAPRKPMPIYEASRPVAAPLLASTGR